MGNPRVMVLKHTNSWSTKELHQQLWQQLCGTVFRNSYSAKELHRQPWQQLCSTVIITSIALVTTADTDSQNSTSSISLRKMNGQMRTLSNTRTLKIKTTTKHNITCAQSYWPTLTEWVPRAETCHTGETRQRQTDTLSGQTLAVVDEDVQENCMMQLQHGDLSSSNSSSNNCVESRPCVQAECDEDRSVPGWHIHWGREPQRERGVGGWEEWAERWKSPARYCANRQPINTSDTATEPHHHDREGAKNHSHRYPRI